MVRKLLFKVERQKLSKDESCSFEGIVSGTVGYLRAKFLFDKEWEGYACVAVFKKLMEEFPVPLRNCECEIPKEALDWDKFYVRIVGRNKNGAIVTTNEVEVNQKRE